MLFILPNIGTSRLNHFRKFDPNHSDQFIQLLGRIILHGWQHMGIGIQRQADIRMPEAFLNDFGICQYLGLLYQVYSARMYQFSVGCALKII